MPEGISQDGETIVPFRMCVGHELGYTPLSVSKLWHDCPLLLQTQLQMPPNGWQPPQRSPRLLTILFSIWGAYIGIHQWQAGIVETPMTQPMLDDKARRAQLEHVVPMPIGRHGGPEEIAELLLWLASPANSMMVGQMLFIDGGAEATVHGDTLW